MSVYKVERKVDTVIVEMDISVAEALSEILYVVQDNTRDGLSYRGSALRDLQARLREDADVRFPSPSYKVEPKDGVVILTNRNHDDLSYENAYIAEFGTNDLCAECGGKFERHFLSCSTWGFKEVGKA